MGPLVKGCDGCHHQVMPGRAIVVEIDDFIEAVKRVGRGGTAMDPQVVSQLVGKRRKDDPVDDLSPREREVLGLMAEGARMPASA